MKAYLVVTGLVFALLALVHVWRIAVEGVHLASNLPFVAITLVAASLSIWAFWLLARRR